MHIIIYPYKNTYQRDWKESGHVSSIWIKKEIIHLEEKILIYIEAKKDIAAPAVVTEILPDMVITRLVAQSTADGAAMGEELWKKVDRKEFFSEEEWAAFVEKTEKECRANGYAEDEMQTKVIRDKYRVYLKTSHRNELDRKEWVDYLTKGTEPLERVIRDMMALCFVAFLPV